MGTKKYFFFDYDGTLAIPITRNIPDSTRETLRLLEAQGHFVALATGRLQCNALDFIDSAGIRNVVSDGGNSVTVDGKLLWMRSLDLPPVKACLHHLDDLGVPWAVTTDNVPWRVSSKTSAAVLHRRDLLNRWASSMSLLPCPRLCAPTLRNSMSAIAGIQRGYRIIF